MKRSNDQLHQEIEFLIKHLNSKFNHNLQLANFSEQVSKIISERIEDYIYQRYRDWDSLELLALLDEWRKTEAPKKTPEKIELIEEVKSSFEPKKKRK